MPITRSRIACVLTFVGIVAVLWAGGRISYAQEEVTILKDEAVIVFPRLVAFNLSAQAEEQIVAAEIEYGSLALTCGPVTTVGRPDFAPATEVALNWRWQVTEGEILPPGAQIWWRWRLTMANGTTVITQEQHESFNDRWFLWQSKERENLRVHWYRGEQTLADEMLAVGLDVLNQMADETGLQLTQPIDIYLYEDPTSLRASVPGAPGWIGGIAFPEHSIVLILASPDYLAESGRILRHELGHLVITRLTFNCATTPPTWLAEGLAMIAEGVDDGLYANELSAAIEDGRLLSLAQLEGSFSVHDRTAGLAYAESYSIVRFLIEEYGQAPLVTLIEHLAAGESFDSAAATIYDLDIATLEDKWRAAVGAQPQTLEEQVQSEPPTAVPTFALPTQEISEATPVIRPSASVTPPLARPTSTAQQNGVIVVASDRVSTPEADDLSDLVEAEPTGSLWPYWPFILATLLIILLALSSWLLLRRSSRTD